MACVQSLFIFEIPPVDRSIVFSFSTPLLPCVLLGQVHCRRLLAHRIDVEIVTVEKMVFNVIEPCVH